MYVCVPLPVCWGYLVFCVKKCVCCVCIMSCGCSFRLALDGGEDGLALIRTLISRAPQWCRVSPAPLFLEVDDTHRDALSCMLPPLTSSFRLSNDCQGRFRFVEAHVL